MCLNASHLFSRSPWRILMKLGSIWIALVAVYLFFVPAARAQAQSSGNQNLSVASGAVVPQLIKFSGTLLDAQSRPIATGPVGVTFALYAEQTGGASLWLETQNVRPDESGYYTALLGAETSTGVPMELFATGEARWLGIQIERQPEQPRVLLVSVPYALKAGDAQTLGGRPASDFALANASSVSSAPTTAKSAAPSATAAAISAVQNPTTSITGTGVADFIPLWTSSTALGDSVLFQSTTKKIGIGNTAPAATLDVTGSGIFRGFLQLPATGTANSTTKGFPSQPFDFLASAYNGTAAVSEHFRWQAEPVNPGLSTASGKLNLLFASGTGTPAETGLSVSNKGVITFATGQTLPKVTGNEAVTGNLSATGSVSGATGTFTGNVSTGNQTVSGNITATGSIAAGTGTFTANNSTQVLSVTQTGTGAAAVFNVTKSTDTILKAELNGSAVFSVNASSGLFDQQQLFTSGTIANDAFIVSPTGAVSTLNSDTGNGATAISASQNDSNNSDITFGVNASTASESGVGVKGTSSTSSVSGGNLNSAGVWGDTGAGGGIGVIATADDGYGVYAQSNSANPIIPTIYAYNSSTTAGALAFKSGGGGGACTIDVNGSLSCHGSKSAVVPVENGQKMVALYAVEAPENWFEDYGSEHLENGAATVTLDPTYAQTVNTGMEYHVFLTPSGDCNGLYVTNKTANSFEVRELKGGHSNIAFDYRIIAKRNGYEQVRLADKTAMMKAVPAQAARFERKPGAQAPANGSAATRSEPKP